MKKQVSRGFSCETQIQVYRLVEKGDEISRYIIAGNPQISKSGLFRFALDSCHRIRSRVSECPSIPLNLLNRLSTDPHPEVRVCASENRIAPQALLERLARDANVDVRYALAENTNTPKVILCMLALDENPYVCSRADNTIERLSIAISKRCGHSILLKLAQAVHSDVNQSASVQR